MERIIDILSAISEFGTKMIDVYQFEFGPTSVEWVGIVLFIALGIYIALGIMIESRSGGELLLGLIWVPITIPIALVIGIKMGTTPLVAVFLGVGLWGYAFAMLSTAVHLFKRSFWYLSFALGVALPIGGFLAPKAKIGSLFHAFWIIVDIAIVTHALFRFSGGFDNDKLGGRFLLLFAFALFGTLVSIAAHSNLKEVVLEKIYNDPNIPFHFQLTRWILISGDVAKKYSRLSFTLAAIVLPISILRRAFAR